MPTGPLWTGAPMTRYLPRGVVRIPAFWQRTQNIGNCPQLPRRSSIIFRRPSAAHWTQTGRYHWRPQSHIVSSRRCLLSTMRFMMPCMRHWSQAGSIRLRCRRRRSTGSHKSVRRSSVHWSIPCSPNIRPVYSPRGKR